MSESGLYAGLDKEGTILVWKEDDTSNWKIISIIIPPKININRVQWIINSKELCFIYKDYLVIWDPFENKVLHEFEFNLISHSIYYYKGIYLITGENRIISTWDGIELNEVSKSGPISWIDNQLFSYPNKIEFFEGELVIREIQMNRQERQLSRQFRKLTDGNLNLDVYVKGDYQLDNIFPSQLAHLIKNKELILILVEDPFIIYQTDEFILIRYFENSKYFLIKNANFIVLKVRDKLILKNSKMEHVIFWDGKALKIKTSDEYFLEDPRSILNAPSYLFANHDHIEYGRINIEQSLLWMKDFHESYTYFDLLGLDTKIVDSVSYKDPKTKIMINKKLNYLLEWNKGNRYPNGLLFLRHLNTGELKLIYNRSDGGKDTTHKSLVIQAWTCIRLFTYYKKRRKQIKLSLSSLYCILDKIGRSTQIESFKYHQIREEINFISYGDLEIENNKRKTAYHGISPIWKVDYERNILITINYDGHCYIWDLINNVPISSFTQGIPHSIEIAPNKSLIAIISFDVKTTEFITASSDKVSTDYPIILLTVHDFGNKKTYRKSMRFPTHMQEFIVQVDYDQAANKFHFQFPSYIDNRNIISVLFDDAVNKFQIINPSSAKRYWQKHDEELSNEGSEFIVTTHPEVNREMRSRDYYILDYSLVRKADDLLIVHAEIDIIEMQQLSSNPLYDESNSIRIQLPFYNDQMKEITILEDTADLLRNVDFINLHPIDSLPKVLELNLNELPTDRSHLDRIKVFILNILKTNSFHTNYGITYASQNYHEFHEQLIEKLREIEVLTN
jgi:hypothetical protein